MKKGQRERILEDLIDVITVDMLANIPRYGTSCRSSIAELRAEGYPIDDEWRESADGARYKVYFIPQEKLAALKGAA